jgi:hypothetical protein
MTKVLRSWAVGWAAVGTLASGALAAAVQTEAVDPQAISEIRTIGLDPAHSQVMAISSWLTDVHGPRLTGSPAIEQAGRWAVDQMRSWGLDRAELEPWPPSTDPASPNNGFPRGWVNEKFYMAVTGAQAFPIVGTPVAWTPGTAGLVRGDAVLVSETTEDALQKYKGTLRGKWVLGANVPNVPVMFTPPATRRTTEELGQLVARGDNPAAGRGRGGRGGRPGGPGGRGTAGPAFNRTEFFRSEGVLGVLSTTARGHGIIVISGASRTADPRTLLPSIVVTAEHYGRIARILAQGIRVTIEADIRNATIANPPMFNVIGEIRGTDKADELVILGAHFDSWHASTGATDNAAGSAVMLEAMRILKVSGLKLRRTVRLALWTGEEQGLIGSALYVRKHFGGTAARGSAPPVPATGAHAKLSGYFNIDNGTGAIRGVYLQQNDAAGPIFRAWMAPFADLGMTHVTRLNTGSTDHESFDAAGLPGWQFIQDPIAYDSMTHHTNLDSYERLIAEDMRKNATIAAAFAYLAANRDERLPRKN